MRAQLTHMALAEQRSFTVRQSRVRLIVGELQGGRRAGAGVVAILQIRAVAVRSIRRSV